MLRRSITFEYLDLWRARKKNLRSRQYFGYFRLNWSVSNTPRVNPSREGVGPRMTSKL